MTEILLLRSDSEKRQTYNDGLLSYENEIGQVQP
jgi:hypothetical protein